MAGVIYYIYIHPEPKARAVYSISASDIIQTLYLRHYNKPQTLFFYISGATRRNMSQTLSAKLGCEIPTAPQSMTKKPPSAALGAPPKPEPPVMKTSEIIISSSQVVSQQRSSTLSGSSLMNMPHPIPQNNAQQCVLRGTIHPLHISKK